MKRKYKNVSEQPQTLIGVGVVKPGDSVTVEGDITNPNFEIVTEHQRMRGDDPVTKSKISKKRK